MSDELDSEERQRTSFRDYWLIVVRHRWYLMGPLFLCGLLGFIVARAWPLLYRSEALILVEQQKVPEQYVTPNITTNLRNRLDSITQQILSRTRLQRLIEDFNLYAKERARGGLDDVIDTMRKHIAVEPVITQSRLGELTGFKISYAVDSAQLAQRVTNELTSQFIEENLRTRMQQSVNTTSFLENQLETARKGLEEQEHLLREYKMRYLGELPEQQQSNLHILSSLEAQLRAGTDSLDRAEQQKLYLESTRTEYQAVEKSLLEAKDRIDASTTSSPTVSPAELTLQALRKQLTELKTKYTPEHPDIHTLEQQIASWEAINTGSRVEDHQAHRPRLESHGKSNDSTLIETESRLKAIVFEIDTRKKEVTALQARIRDFQGRLSLTPVREQQLAEVTRMHENARSNYQSLLQKKLQSELASNLEKRQQGEVFRILDPASLPGKPTDRLQVIGYSWLAGLCIGILLTAIRELSDNAVRTEKQLHACAPFPIILRIPVVTSPNGERRRKWRTGAEFAAAMSLTLLSIAGGIKMYFTA